jgi:hypothetical protein
MIETIIFCAVLGIAFGFAIHKPRTESYFPMYREAGITIEQELHNFHVKLEREMEERKYQMDLRNADYDDRLKTFHHFKHLLNDLSPEEQLKYIPKWVEYLCKEAMKKKTDFDLFMPEMSLDEFIVNEITPFHFCTTLGICKRARFDIIYV